jgi:hypothetical protein
MVLNKETAQPSSPLFQLERVLGAEWPHLRNAIAETGTVVNELDQLLRSCAKITPHSLVKLSQFK